MPLWRSVAQVVGLVLTPPPPISPFSRQGDVRFAEVMGLMGAKVEWAPYSITITGEGVQIVMPEGVGITGVGVAPNPLTITGNAGSRLPCTACKQVARWLALLQARPAASSRRWTTTATTSPTPP